MNNYVQNVFGVIKNLLNISDDKIFDQSQSDIYNKKLNSSKFELPAIVIFEKDNFIPSITQTDIDLNKEIKTSVDFTINLFSYDVDELVDLENKFIHLLNKENNVINNDCIRSATLSFDSNVDIDRSTFTFDNGKQQYRSVFKINYKGIILSKLDVNPIKMELDKNFQIQVMKQLCLLNEVYNLTTDEIFKLLETNGLNESLSFEDELSNMPIEIKHQYEKLLEQKNKLIEQIDYMYTFEKLCQTKITLDDNGFKECYGYMINDKIDITQATAKHKKRIENDEEKRRQEAEKIKKLRKHFSKNGDKQLNRYTDKVVQDIKANLSTGFDMLLYGGSTFSEWYNLYHENKIIYPNILVLDNIKYNLSGKSYQNEDINSNLISHDYNTSALPVLYWFSVRIFTENESQAKLIEQQIINAYSNERKIKIPDVSLENENTVIILKIDDNIEIERKQFGSLYRTTISFKQYDSVYYVQSVDPEECVDNQRLQLRLLQQAHYVMVKSNQVDTAIQRIDYDYKPLINRKMKLFGVCDSDDYKKVKNLFNCNMPISKDLFDSAFKLIVCVYPDLYQKFTNGYPYEQIKKDLFEIKKYYNSRCNLLLDALNVPKTLSEKMAESAEKLGCTVEKTSGGNEISLRTEESLIFLINKMSDPYCELETLYDEFKQKKIQEIQIARERRLLEQEERAARREEEYYNGGGSSFLGDIFKTATGVAVGNKVSNKKNDGSGRQNLFGTSLCKYGKKDKYGLSIYCGTRCPVSRECTQRGRYKVGS